MQQWFECFPVDGNGAPTSDISHQLLSIFFSSPAETFAADELAQELSIPQELIELLCRQLEIVFVLRQDPPESYRFTLSHPDERNVQLRRKISAQLVRELVGEITPPRLRFPGENPFDGGSSERFF